MNMGFSQMMSRVDQMISLMGKMRDHTQEEMRDIQEWKNHISDLASTYRKFYGESAKGMNDFSVVLKKTEDDISSYQKSIEETQKEVSSLTEAHKKLSQAMDIEDRSKRHKTLKSILKSDPEWGKGVSVNKLADKRKQEFADYIKLAKAATDEVEKDKKAKELDYQKLVKAGVVGRQKANEEEERKSRRGRGISALQIAGDMNIPGVSQAATITRYAQQFGERDDGSTSGLGLVGGGLLGAGVAAGAYTMYQGYKVYNTAHQMAPISRILSGQMGDDAVSGRQTAITAHGGYGGVENMQYLTQLNRQLGTSGGLANLRGLTDVSNSFGIDRGEAGSLAGTLYQSGGTTPGGASQDLSKILSEGVKAGMDRAKVTEFAQHTMAIQQDLFQTIGQNNSQNVSQALSQIIRGYKGDANNFFRSGSMRAITGLDAGVKNAASSGDGLMFRAFGFGMGGNKGEAGSDYYNAVKEMEGGIFSGSANDQIGKLKKIISQVDSDYGGDQKGANLHLKESYGIGLNQIEQLRETLKGAGGPVTKEQERVLKQIQEGSKDPMQKLLDIQAKSNENLARVAGDKGLGAIITIDEGIKDIQEKALGFLETIANVLGAGDKKTSSEHIEDSWNKNVSSKKGITNKAQGYFDYLTDSETWTGIAGDQVANLKKAGDMVMHPSRFFEGLTNPKIYDSKGNYAPEQANRSDDGELKRVTAAIEKQTQLISTGNAQRAEQLKNQKSKSSTLVNHARQKGRAL
ncbi:MAG: hypothetical protein ACXVB4_01285 [Pseudobdellovibrionaceae bacterium]